ncbi:hypothetical protein BCV69DRAFT_309533 [Microstroma glucosiphilum]|uniref:Phosphoglycerate mutase-like protein n=1 Tax=Pseudomicrostroma glucosiphilum TaxID=1684307 RepID=A0A316UFE9_9BASI|nr:hypothetical protein BCV69DRAFT_309533 [Pseudomicrostroma glucosiphilum]PWN23654.1 hypothetical protein BCV69DRAFT_309533 [Pseudomicrostroma glucosiphilum]
MSMELQAAWSSIPSASAGPRASSTTPPSSPAAIASSLSDPSPVPIPVPSSPPPESSIAAAAVANPPASASTVSETQQQAQSQAESGARPAVRARVILIRHPQTEANAAHLLQGTTDSPLTRLGEEQAGALAGWFAEINREKELDDTMDRDVDMDVRLIVHSPLGRTTRLASLIHTALCDQCTTSSSSSSPPASPVALRASLDLQEKSFGPLECTRRGQHAGPRWPRAPSGAKQEGREEFSKRVRRAGMLWIGKALEMAKQGEEEKEPEDEEHGASVETEKEGLEVGDEPTSDRGGTPPPPSPSRQRPRRRKGIPTILIVTHGLFISTFFKVFPVLPPLRTSKSSSPQARGSASTEVKRGGGGRGGELGSDSRIPFASNTGMYLLDLSAPISPSPCPVPPFSTAAGCTLRLLKANWTPHLPSTTTPGAPGGGGGGGGGGTKRTGREALASAARDPKQRRLDGVGGFFSKPAGTATTMAESGSQEDKRARSGSHEDKETR